MPFTGSKTSAEDPKETLKQFINHSPAAKYTFDSERGANHSEICREGPGQKECIDIKLASTQLFEAMQQHGFFCALPMEPGRTHMECTRIPK